MSRKPLVPEARAALDRLKMEFANEMGIELDEDYQGNKSSRLNGATGGPIGGMMTKKMIEKFQRNLIDK